VQHHLLESAESLLSSATEQCALITTLEALDTFRIQFLGRKGFLATLSDTFVKLSPEEKRLTGSRFQEIKKLIDELYTKKKSSLESSTTNNTCFIDFSAVQPQQNHPGKLHVYTQVIERIENIFIPMGYTKFEGPEVEDEFHNFDALNVPSNHPARDMHDTLWVNNTEQLLRTHTSSVQIRALEEHGIPIAGFAPGRVFRHEAVDATHDIMFMQCEGIFIDKGINLSNLLGTAKHFLSRFFETKDLDIRIRPGFFPFVEPGLEIDMRCVFCKNGCSVCKKTTWIEVFPCGMIHPNVLKACNINPEIYSGFAFGFGLSRVVMLYHGIDDIRHLSTGKIGFLKQF
jgi:phenylalanyl-tRNA synthetase alpha chain